MTLKLKEEQRCSVPYIRQGNPSNEICSDPKGMEQTNCSDTSRIAIIGCTLRGAPLTISIFGSCHLDRWQLCDDDYNNKCEGYNTDCWVHKGQLCNGYTDCHSSAMWRTDEGNCGAMTKVFKCERRYHIPYSDRRPLSLPMKWVMDGEVDCVDGSDEMEDKWLTCGRKSDNTDR